MGRPVAATVLEGALPNGVQGGLHERRPHLESAPAPSIGSSPAAWGPSGCGPGQGAWWSTTEKVFAREEEDEVG